MDVHLFFSIGHPGARLECVCSAGGLLADLLLAKAGCSCVAFDYSLGESSHQTLLILLSLEEHISLLHLHGLLFDLLPVLLILQQLLDGGGLLPSASDPSIPFRWYAAFPVLVFCGIGCYHHPLGTDRPSRPSLLFRDDVIFVSKRICTNMLTDYSKRPP